MEENKEYQSVESLEFVSTKIHKTSNHGHIDKHKYRYALNLPQFLAEWDVWDYWEMENVEHMRKTLHHSDSLIVVGAEHGYMASIYGLFLNPGRIALIEPSPDFWPGMRAIWQNNFVADPLFTYQGFMGSRCSHQYQRKEAPHINGWVTAAYSHRVCRTRPYRYINEPSHTLRIPTMTIDRIVSATGYFPNALSIDVEGAEFEVLQGAKRTLLKYKPMGVWVSIHPDLMMQNFGHTPEELIEWMEGLGYYHEHISTDHEEHHFFGA